jgi:hypothetical protein
VLPWHTLVPSTLSLRPYLNKTISPEIRRRITLIFYDESLTVVFHFGDKKLCRTSVMKCQLASGRRSSYFLPKCKEPFGIVTRKYYKCTKMIFSWNYIVRKSFLSNRRHWQPARGNYHHDGSNIWCTVCLVLAEPWVPIMLSSMRRCSVAGRLSFGPPKRANGICASCSVPH